MIRALLGLLAFVLCASAQQTSEFGATVGGGVFAAEDTGSPAYVTLGIEACALCSGRFAIFGEYTHWAIAGAGRQGARITTVELIAGGLRLQGKGRVRPFFDVGFAGGWDRFEYYGGRASHGNPGVVLGGGAALPLRGGWYIRPQIRMSALRALHVGLGASIGIGYRFGPK